MGRKRIYTEEEAKEAKRKSNREYARKNRETMYAYRKRYYRENKEIILEKQKEYRKRNPQISSNYVKRNRKIISEKQNIYRKLSPKVYADCILRRRNRKNNLLNDFSTEDKIFMLIFFDRKCCYCNNNLNEKYHLDHFIPLSKGGATTKTNILPSCPSCNLRKSHKEPNKWVLDNFDESVLNNILDYFNLFNKNF